jgi:hypothetical protein
LSASPAAAAQFASSTLVIAAGKTSGSVKLNTFAVSANTPVTFTASYNGTATGTETVTAATLSAFSLNTTSVVGGSSTMITGTITLNGPAGPGGAKVTLASNNAAALVPGTATVPAGATTVTFSFSTKAVTKVTKTSVSATLSTAKKSVSLTISP